MSAEVQIKTNLQKYTKVIEDTEEYDYRENEKSVISYDTLKFMPAYGTNINWKHFVYHCGL